MVQKLKSECLSLLIDCESKLNRHCSHKAFFVSAPIKVSLIFRTLVLQLDIQKLGLILIQFRSYNVEAIEVKFLIQNFIHLTFTNHIPQSLNAFK